MSIVVSVHTIAIDAFIIKGRLEAEGIPAFIQDSHYITADWTLSNAVGGVKINVPDECKATALAILQATENDDYQISKLEADLTPEQAEIYLPEEPLHCPTCNADKISRLEWPRRLALVFLFLLSTPIVFTQQYYVCDSCGKVFAPNRGDFSRYLTMLFIILSICLSLLVSLTLMTTSYSPETYLSRANGGNATLMINDVPPDWEYEEMME